MQGARKEEYAHTTLRTPETTQYEHIFDIDKMASDEIYKKKNTRLDTRHGYSLDEDI